MHASIKPRLLLGLLLLVLVVNPIQAQWQAQNSPVSDYLYDAYCFNNQTAFAVGWGASSGAVILKTTDGGENWDYSIPLERSLLFKVTFVDSDIGYACGYDGFSSSALLLMTVDGGNEWFSQTFNQSFGFYVVQFPTERIGYVCGYNGAILKTVDGGNNWRLQQTGTQSVFRLMQFIDENHGWAVAGTNFNNPSMVYHTSDGGTHWSMVHNFNGSFVVGGIAFIDSSTGVAVGNDGHEAIYRTTDGGDNWEKVYSTNSQTVLQDVTLGGMRGYAVGDGGKIHITTDGGENWAVDTVFQSAPLMSSVDSRDNFTFAVGEGGKIYTRNEPNEIPPSHGSIQPVETRLIGNYPNPFNSTTSIRFAVSTEGLVDFSLLDMTGREVWREKPEFYTAGQYQLPVALPNTPSGSYQLRMNAGDGVGWRNIQLLK